MSQLDTSSPPTTNARGHFAWLDSLRAIAALWVLLFHDLLTVHPQQAPAPVQALLKFFMSGHQAVTLFIAISGFSLSLGLVRRNWKLRDGYLGFYISRICRIVPPFYISIACSLLLIAAFIGRKTGTNWDYSIPVRSQDVAVHLLLLQDLWSQKINYVYWSVAVETHLYLLFPPGLYILARYGKWALAGFVSVVLAGAFLALPLAIGPHLVGTIAAFCLVFPLGCLASILAQKQTAIRKSHVWIAGIVCLALHVASKKLLPGHPTFVQFWEDLTFGSVCAIGMYGLATARNTPKLLESKKLAFIGTFAYSIYLTHAPIIQVLYQAFKFPLYGNGATVLGFMALSLVVCLPIAYGFHLIAERPFFQLRHSVSKLVVARLLRYRNLDAERVNKLFGTS